MSSPNYTDLHNSHQAQKQIRLESARTLLQSIGEFIDTSSVADVGCGLGFVLHVVQEAGARDIHGFEYEGFDLAMALQDIRNHIRLVNLERDELGLPNRVGTCFTLEVAEHLHPPAAEAFVRKLTDCSDLIVFSAAIPQQGGDNHHNEQWPEYWAKIFSNYGYECFDIVRPRIWRNQKILWWLRQNCVIYAKNGSDAYKRIKALGYNSSLPLPLVHPEAFAGRTANVNQLSKLAEVGRVILEAARKHQKVAVSVQDGKVTISGLAT